jgi:hypothetical protein
VGITARPIAIITKGNTSRYLKSLLPMLNWKIKNEWEVFDSVEAGAEYLHRSLDNANSHIVKKENQDRRL